MEEGTIPVSLPPDVKVDIILTEGDFSALIEHMQSNQPIEIEIPNVKINGTKKRDRLVKVRKWRLIEVGDEGV